MPRCAATAAKTPLPDEWVPLLKISKDSETDKLLSDTEEDQVSTDDDGSNVSDEETITDLDEFISASHGDRRRASCVDTGHPRDIMQFSTSIYYACEDEGSVTIEVVRFGAANGIVSIAYATCNRAGDQAEGIAYKKVAGTLHFAHGEVMKTIEIPILRQRTWDVTHEFILRLSDPDGHAILSQDLDICRVKILNVDPFPSDKFNRQAVSRDWDNVSGFRLWLEYFKLNMLQPGTGWRAMIRILGDQVDNIYIVCKVFATQVLVDQVLSKQVEDPETALDYDNELMEVVVAAIYVLPFFILFAFDFGKINFRLIGRSNKVIQSALVRVYLECEESYRATISPADMAMMMTRDTDEVVLKGFMQVFPLIQNLGKLICLSAFQISIEPVAALPLLIFPIIMATLLKLNEKHTKKVLDKRREGHDELVHSGTEVVRNFRVIADYYRRPEVVMNHESKIANYNSAALKVLKNDVYIDYIVPFLTVITCGLYIIYASRTIGRGTSLGTFLSTLSVLQAMGTSFQSIQRNLVNIQSTFSPLTVITEFLNFPSDLLKQRQHIREIREQGKLRIRKAREKLETEGALRKRKSRRSARSMSIITKDLARANFFRPGDDLAISLENVTISYALNNPTSPRRSTIIKVDTSPHLFRRSSGLVMQDISFTITQGRFVALDGPRNSGKSTLLRIIGQAHLPEQGQGHVFMPPHLRVLHIGTSPQFLDLSLLDNLTWGCNTTPPLSRILRVCRRMGMAEWIIQMLEDDASLAKECPEKKNLQLHEAGLRWERTFSYSEACTFALARALIYNPEVLVVHRPLHHFDADHASQVLQVLREFVDERGFTHSVGDPISERVPRTLIISTSNVQAKAVADTVLYIADGTVRIVRDS